MPPYSKAQENTFCLKFGYLISLIICHENFSGSVQGAHIGNFQKYVTGLEGSQGNLEQQFLSIIH